MKGKSAGQLFSLFAEDFETSPRGVVRIGWYALTFETRRTGDLISSIFLAER
jgi:hypothetical protein